MSPEHVARVVEVQTFLNEWGVVLGGIALIGFMVWFFTSPKTVIPGEEKMDSREKYVLSKRQRKQRVHTLLADGIGDVLLDLYTNGEMTQEEYRRWHMRFGTQLALKDLLPQKLTPEEVKAAMKKRIGNGVYKPIPFFVEKKEARPKNIVDKILAPHFVPVENAR